MAGETGYPRVESSPADEPELFYVNCGYSLTGLTEERCPECGEGFDRAEMLALERMEPQPLKLNDDPRARTQVGVFLAALFRPAEVGRRLPGRIRDEEIYGYNVWVKTLATFAAPTVLATWLTIDEGAPVILAIVLPAVAVLGVGL